MEIIRCVVVEDEIPVRDELIYILKASEKVEVISTQSNGEDALNYLKNNKVDLLFMDVNIPGINGIQVTERLRETDFKGVIIFITSYDNYAIKAFELEAIDYILKPFDKRRVELAINRAYRYYENRNNVKITKESCLEDKVQELIKYIEKDKSRLKKFPCELYGRTIFLDVDQVYFCFSLNECTYVKTKDTEYLTSFTLSEIEEKTSFFRVHRSFIINTKYVKEAYALFNYNFKVVMGDDKNTEIPVSRNKVKDLKRELGFK